MSGSATSIGQEAESTVCDFLVNKGYKILERNWRTRYCEIDIVASHDSVVNFIEVKYRVRPDQGDGFEYITPAKLRQMNFAAELWLSQNDWDGDSQLMAAEVTGNNFENIKLVEV